MRQQEKSLDAAAKSLIGDIETPAEKFQQKMASIDALWNTGRISAEQYGRAALKAVEDAEKAMGTADKPLNFLLRGSQAERSFSLQQDRDIAKGKQSFEDRRKTVEGQLLTAQQQSTRAMQDLTRALEERRQYSEEVGDLDSQ
jgi:hypothetical protein